jgi:signal transduction histidine kinase
VAQQKFDLILCDHGLPGYDGSTALRLARRLQPETPVIMLSGVLDDAHAVESLKSGATDYILKQRLARLVPAIRRALHEAEEHAEKKVMEALVLRAQRMDSLGALAGGIAHDLNNALTPVLMSVELLKDRPDDEARERLLDIINTSAQRAAGMVKQILGFARGLGGTGPLEVGHLVREMAGMIQDTFPKSISISVQLGGSELWLIQGDATELHQVLLNLCVNARDAMPNGGRLTFSARNARLDQEAARPFHAAAGPYVLVSVTDSGHGIPPEVLPRVFEPFFTTKSPGRGTGLGLSTVASIVKHHGGFIDIETAPGRGTEFRVYFPADESSHEAQPGRQQIALPAGHGELVLLIEDEEAVRELTKTTLENFGYRVVTAQNGVQGISRFEEHKDNIKVLITDADMPQMGGLAAMRAMKELKPELPVIMASGSKHDAEETRGMDARRLSTLGKPFSLEQLLIAVNIALHS